MAHDAGLELEGDLARQVQQRQAEKRQHEKRIKGATGNLKHLLSQPLLPRQVPTSFDAMLFGEGDDVLTAFNNASNNSKNSDSSVSQQETQETPLQEDDNANEQQDSEDESDSESDVYVSDY
ncbi:MAG: hypothetical protein MHM6MM_009596 [Cercozoa sp. M6MM]